MSLYNADGQINTTQVVGSSYTGLHAADGSLNIVINASSSYVGLHHPCGALNAFVTTNPSAGYYAPNGSVYVIANSFSGYSPIIPRGTGTNLPAGPASPVLTWAGVTTDSTPDFQVDLPSGNGAPLDAAVGDVLRIQYQLQSGGAFTDYLTHTLVIGDITGSPITQSGVTPVANGLYYFSGRLERTGAASSAWSANASVTISASSSSPTYYILGF